MVLTVYCLYGIITVVILVIFSKPLLLSENTNHELETTEAQ
jgi:hypothetical protein